MGEPHPDLMTRVEAAAMMRVSVSKLKQGWGPPPLPQYKRPVMYWRPTIMEWFKDGGSACSSAETNRHSGGRSSSTRESATVSQRVRQIEKRRRLRLAGSASKSNKTPALVTLAQESP